MSEEGRYRPASLDDLSELSVLFDAYRQFYACASDLAAARSWLSTNLSERRSVIFLAEDSDGVLLGFTQLYPALCSVDLVEYYVLYDLYVDQGARRQGLGRGLMAAAEQHARSLGMARLDLETAKDNAAAQSLYHRLGFVRDDLFHKYSLELV